MRSLDVGQAFDVVFGFRNIFEVRRLGIDLRAGRFFPGDAFRNSIGDERCEKAQTATAVVMKLWW